MECNYLYKILCFWHWHEGLHIDVSVYEGSWSAKVIRCTIMQRIYDLLHFVVVRYQSGLAISHKPCRIWIKYLNDMYLYIVLDGGDIWTCLCALSTKVYANYQRRMGRQWLAHILPWKTSSWWCHQMETFSALLSICAGTSPTPVNSPSKGQWRGALMFSLICAWMNYWVNNGEAGDLRRHRAHYDVTVMFAKHIVLSTGTMTSSCVCVFSVYGECCHAILNIYWELDYYLAANCKYINHTIFLIKMACLIWYERYIKI